MLKEAIIIWNVFLKYFGSLIMGVVNKTKVIKETIKIERNKNLF
jgi:hypothetical protein